MKVSDTKGFVEGITQYIQKEGKQSLLPKVTELFGKLSSQAQRDTVAKVTTSVALSKDEQASVEKVLYRLMGREVAVSMNVDPSLIGGMKIKIGDWVVDTSLSGQLDTMGHEILQ